MAAETWLKSAWRPCQHIRHLARCGGLIEFGAGLGGRVLQPRPGDRPWGRRGSSDMHKMARWQASSHNELPKSPLSLLSQWLLNSMCFLPFLWRPEVQAFTARAYYKQVLMANFQIPISSVADEARGEDAFERGASQVQIILILVQAAQ